jgi:hypothetical protein
MNAKPLKVFVRTVIRHGHKGGAVEDMLQYNMKNIAKHCTLTNNLLHRHTDLS